RCCEQICYSPRRLRPRPARRSSDLQRDGICVEVLAPAPGLDPEEAAEAQRIALSIADELGVTGLLAVEMFQTRHGLLVNELAMRDRKSTRLNSSHVKISYAVFGIKN